MTKYLGIAIAGLIAALCLCGWLLKNAWAENGAIETKLKSAQAIIDQRELDMRENARVIGQLSQKLNDTETKVVTVTEKIYVAPKTVVCGDQPSIRIAVDSVPGIYGPAVPPADRRQPAPVVPATGAPTRISKRQRAGGVHRPPGAILRRLPGQARRPH